MSSNPLTQLTSVRSQLGEQALVWLAYVRDYPDHETMPGKPFGLPPYYKKELGRNPTKLYIPPLVEKTVPKPQHDHERDTPGSDPSQGQKVRSANDVTGDAPPDDDATKRRMHEPEKHKITVPWASELRLAPAGWRGLITGAPGQGKSWMSQMTASQIADDTYQQLYNQTARIDDLPLPICLRVDDLLDQCGEQANQSNTFTASHVSAAVKHLLGSVKPFDQTALVQLPHFAGYVEQHLQEKRFWLFLDALDELKDTATNQQRLRSLFLAINDWDIRVLVTSRPYAGRRFDNATADYAGKRATYELSPLSPRQATAFVDRWFNPLATAPEQDIHAELRKPAYRAIAQSPQLLTLLCVVASTTGGQLPTGRRITRTQVYHAIFETLFQHVERNDETQRLPSFEDIAPELERIARAMVSSPVQADNSAALLSIRHRKLRMTIVNIKDERDYKPEHEHFIDSRLNLYKDLRLLCPTTHDNTSEWQFTHREFAAFFAGSAFATQHNTAMLPDDDGLDDDEPRNLLEAKEVEGFLARRVWDPDWERIIAFFFGQAQFPAGLLENLSSPDVYTRSGKNLGQDRFRYRLFVAARMLAEITLPERIVPTPEIEYQIDAVTKKTLQHLLAEVERYGRNVWKNSARNVWFCLGSKPPTSTPLFLRLLENNSSAFAHVDAVKALIQIATQADTYTQQRIVAILQNMIENGSSELIRQAAATALGGLAMKAGVLTQQRIIAIFQTTLENPTSESACQAAATALGQITIRAANSTQQRVIAILQKTLENHNWDGPRVAAATALGQLVTQADITTQQCVVAILENSLENNSSYSARANVTIALGQLATQTNPLIQTHVISTLESTIKKSLELALDAVTALGHIATKVDTSTQQHVVAILDNTINNHPSGFVRGEVTTALGRLATQADIPTQRRVIGIIDKTLKNDSSDFARRDATTALGRLATQADAVTQQRIIAILQDTLENHASELARGDAATALGELALQVDTLTRRHVIKILDSSIENYVSEFVSRAAATALGGFAKEASFPTQQRVIATFQKTLENHASELSRDAATALGQLVTQADTATQQRIIAILQNTLENHASELACDAASAALGQLATQADTLIQRDIIAILDSAIQNTPSYFAGEGIINGLSQLAKQTDTRTQKYVISILQNTLENHTSWIARRYAATALGRLATHADISIQQHVLTILENSSLEFAHAAATTAFDQLMTDPGRRFIWTADEAELLTFPSPQTLIETLNCG